MPASTEPPSSTPLRNSAAGDLTAANSREATRLVPKTTLPGAEDILNSLSDAFIALDHEWRIAFVNSSYVTLVAKLYPTAEHLLGYNLWEKFPDIVGTDIGNRYLAAMASQKADLVEMYYAPINTWLELRIQPTPRILSIYVRDISEKKRHEVNASFVSSLSQDLGLLRNPQEIVSHASRSIGQFLGVDRCYFAHFNEDASLTTVEHDWMLGDLAPLAGIHRPGDFGTTEMWTAISSEPLAIDDTHSHPLVRGCIQGYQPLQIRAHATAPYFREGRCLGHIAVTSRQPREWRKDETTLLEDAVARVWPFMEQARSQQQLLESETRQRELMKALPVACFTVDVEGRLTFFNDAAVKLLGRVPKLGEAHWRGAAAISALDGSAIPIEQLPANIALSEKRSVRGMELNIYRPDGSRRRVIPHPDPVFDAEGRCIGVINVVLDVTEEHLAHEKIQKTADHLSLAISAANLGDWNWDAATDRISLSPRACEIYGLTSSEGVTRTQMREFLHADDRERSVEALRKSMQTRTDYDIEYRVIHRDGTLHWVTAKGRSFYGPDGEIAGMVGMVQDVTDRKRQLEEVQTLSQKIEEQARTFDTALSHTTDFSYVFNLEGRFVYVNKPLLDLWGLKLEQAVGKNFFELQYPDALAARLQRQIQQVIETREPVRDETPYTNSAGDEGFFEYIFNAVLDSNGKVAAVVGSTRSITERKRAEAVGEGHRRVLQLIAEDASLNQILGALMSTAELGSPTKIFASVMVLSEGRLQIGAAPSLPPTFNAAIDGLAVGPSAGCCGMAAWTKQPIYASDISTDPLLVDYRDLALSHGLRACWSMPIISSQGDVLGTFAMYFPEPREPNKADLAIADLAIRTAAIALENKRASAALRQSENHLRIALEAARLGSWEWDAATGEVISSARCKANFGVSPDVKNFGELDYSMLIHPEDSPRVEAATLAAAESTEIYEMEYRVIWPDKTLHWIVESGRGLRDENGNIAKVVGITYDITERKLAEETLRLSENQLRLVTDNAPVLLVRVDHEHRYTFVNRAYAERHRLKPDEIIGRHIAEVVGLHAYQNIKDRIQQAFAGKRVEFELEIPYEKTGDRWTHVIYVAERDPEGRITGVLGVITDIAARKQAELELKRARDEAVDASRAKDDFIAALSHELRTPLNPVLLLASDAAGNPELPPKIRADFDLIRKNIDLEARLIDDLLDLTRITRGKLQLEKTRCDLHDVLHDAISNVQPDLEEKHLELITRFEAPNHQVLGDGVRLQQVFWNILKNAVKFTPHHGRVYLETKQADARDSLAVRITDTGIGMTPGEIARAFQAFVQGDHASGGPSLHRFGGLGLGLAISKMLVDLHAGQIESFSDGRDKGCTFVVTLPLWTATSQPNGGSLPTNSSVKNHSSFPFGTTPNRTKLTTSDSLRRILLVEDHAPTRLTLQHLLKSRNFDVATAASAADARRAAATNQFDLLISDMGLPDGNGCELIADLRAASPRLVGIALSGYGMDDDLVRSQTAGFSVHLVKPVTINMLEDAINSLAHSHPGETTPPARS